IAEARAGDGVTGRTSLPVDITEARLNLKLDGPTAGMVGEMLSFRVTVTNDGDSPANQIRVQGRFDDGLQSAGKAAALDETISSPGVGQSKVITLPLSAGQGGTFGIQVAAAGDRGLSAVPKTATVVIKDAQLSLSAHGPSRGYVGQEATWQFVVRNT